MTAYTRNRLRMLRATLALFDEQPDLWTGHDPIVRNVAAVRDGLAVLDAAARTQTRNAPAGLTTAKKEARADANAALGALGSVGGAYATESGDADFRVAVVRSRRDWARLAEAEFFAAAAVALTRLDGALDRLAGYGVTAASVEEARAAVEAIRPRTSRRDLARSRRVAATAALRTGYSALVEPLAILDALVPGLVADPSFAGRYAVVRRVVGR